MGEIYTQGDSQQHYPTWSFALWSWTGAKKGHCLVSKLLVLRPLWFRYQLNALKGKDSSGTCETVLLQTQHLYLLPRRWLITLKWNTGTYFCSRLMHLQSGRWWRERENTSSGSLSDTKQGFSCWGGLVLIKRPQGQICILARMQRGWRNFASPSTVLLKSSHMEEITARGPREFPPGHQIWVLQSAEVSSMTFPRQRLESYYRAQANLPCKCKWQFSFLNRLRFEGKWL